MSFSRRPSVSINQGPCHRGCLNSKFPGDGIGRVNFLKGTSPNCQCLTGAMLGVDLGRVELLDFILCFGKHKQGVIPCVFLGIFYVLPSPRSQILWTSSTTVRTDSAWSVAKLVLCNPTMEPC